MKKIKLKKVKKTKPFDFIIYIAFTIVISLILIFKIIGNKINDKVSVVATSKARRIIVYVINKSVSEEVIKKLDTDFFYEKGNAITLDNAKVNTVLLLINKNLKNNLKNLEEGKMNLQELDISNTKKDVIYEIPSGIIFNNALLSNIGPKIPVKLHLVGDIETVTKTNVKDYGINNAIIEVYAEVKVNEQIILPFSYKTITIKEKIPISTKLFQGEIPKYYATDGKSNVVIENET